MNIEKVDDNVFDQLGPMAHRIYVIMTQETKSHVERMEALSALAEERGDLVGAASCSKVLAETKAMAVAMSMQSASTLLANAPPPLELTDRAQDAEKDARVPLGFVTMAAIDPTSEGEDDKPAED